MRRLPGVLVLLLLVSGYLGGDILQATEEAQITSPPLETPAPTDNPLEAFNISREDMNTTKRRLLRSVYGRAGHLNVSTQAPEPTSVPTTTATPITTAPPQTTTIPPTSTSVPSPTTSPATKSQINQARFIALAILAISITMVLVLNARGLIDAKKVIDNIREMIKKRRK